MPGVEVHREHRIAAQLVQAGLIAPRWNRPRGVQVPAVLARVPGDVVADSARRGLGGDLVTTVRKANTAGEPVPAVRTVRQMGERSWQLDLQPALLRTPSGSSVAPGLVFLAISGDEPAPGLPAASPLIFALSPPHQGGGGRGRGRGHPGTPTPGPRRGEPRPLPGGRRASATAAASPTAPAGRRILAPDRSGRRPGRPAYDGYGQSLPADYGLRPAGCARPNPVRRCQFW